MLNRANVLLNKVKIKFVNTTNALDYSYEKYGVNSSLEMRHIWEKYSYEKEKERRYRKNSQLLAGYEDNLENGRPGADGAGRGLHPRLHG